jgi:O-antigen/teichoic acid export membrane protein
MINFKHGRSIIFAYAGVAFPALIAFFLYPNLIKNLGIERFGALSLLLSVTIFFNSFDLGVGLAITRYVARFTARAANKFAVPRLVGHAIAVQLLIGIFIAGLLIAIHNATGALGSSSDEQLRVEFDGALMWVALSIPMALVAGVIRSALEGIGRFGLANALRAPASIGIFFAPIALSFYTDRIDILILAMLIVRIATTLVFLLIWFQIVGHDTPVQFKLINLKRHSQLLMTYGGWVMLGVVSGGLIVLGTLDRLIIANIVGISSVIQYSIPSDVITRLLLVPAAIASVLITIVTGAVATNPRNLADINRRAVGLVSGQVGPISALLIIHAERLLAGITGQPVSEAAVQILQGMAAGYFIHSLAHVAYCSLHAAGLPKAASSRHLIQLPFYAVGSLLLLSSDHINWLGWMWCIWAFIDLVMLLLLLRWLAPDQRPFSMLVDIGGVFWLVVIGASVWLSVGGPSILATFSYTIFLCILFVKNIILIAGRNNILD